MKLKAFAIAVGLAASVGAQAAVEVNGGGNPNPSELLLAVVNADRNKSVAIDLDVGTADLGSNFTVTTNDAGLDIVGEILNVFGSTDGLSYALLGVVNNRPSFRGVGGIPPRPIFGADPGPLEQGFYVALDERGVANVISDVAGLPGGAGGDSYFDGANLENALKYINAVNDNLEPNGSTGGVMGDVNPARYYRSDFNGDLNGAFDMEVGFGETAALFRMVLTFDTASDAVPDGRAMDPLGFVTLTDEGLAFAPVPIPAAAWLMGSALLGLVGVSRRRFS